MEFSASTWAWIASPWCLGIVGLCVGSFINVVAYRLPKMMERDWWREAAMQLADEESAQRCFGGAAPKEYLAVAQDIDERLTKLAPLGLSKPGSHCPACKKSIPWFENVPILGWLLLRGKCSNCGVRFSIRYLLVELFTGGLFAALAWNAGGQPAALLQCAFAGTLVALTLIDWDTTLLPDSLTLPLLWFGICAAALGWSLPLSTSVIGAVAGYLSLWSVYWLFKLATGKEGMGFGDFKLLGALGAWLGWDAILPIVIMASVIGAAVGLGMKVGGTLRNGRYVPFGPFLAGGGLVVMLVGKQTVLGWIGQ
jgi:leader peptidase (prepilin peptidase)/N-methyltransferase